MGTIAEKLNYLNTTKANIKNAIIEKGVSVSDNDTFRSYASKIADIEPTLGTKTITANGTYNASDDSLQGYSSVTVDIDDTDLYRDTTDSTYESVKTLSNCGAFPMLSLTAEINAVQDLHGYDAPWVGGSGKNLFHVDSRVPTTTISNVGFSSDDEYIYLNGTKQGRGYADLSSADITLDSGTYYIKAFVISGTASNTVELYPYDDSNNLTSSIINTERTLTLSESKTFRFRFAIWTDGTVLNNYKVGIVISKTANIDKFYPYSNICPITGWDSIDVCQSGTDTSNPTTHTTALSTTCYGGSKDIKGNERFTHGHIASYNAETLPSTWISDRDKYAEGTTPTIGAEVVYELATPTTATSDAIDLTLAEGVNNIWANSGNVGDARYFKKVEL